MCSVSFLLCCVVDINRGKEMSDAAVDTICFTIVVMCFLWAVFK